MRSGWLDVIYITSILVIAIGAFSFFLYLGNESEVYKNKCIMAGGIPTAGFHCVKPNSFIEVK